MIIIISIVISTSNYLRLLFIMNFQLGKGSFSVPTLLRTEKITNLISVLTLAIIFLILQPYEILYILLLT
jgi:hypothetical protein